MRRIVLFLTLLYSVFCFSQVQDDFSDGDFTENPLWAGSYSNFMVNANKELQSNATVSSVSYLSTFSEAIKNAVWECHIKINYNPSSSNYACFYLVSENANVTSTNGYFVQVGNTADEVSLYKQTGTTKTKIIDGVDKRVNMNPVDINIKVTRDSLGNWELFSKLSSDSDFVLEGQVLDTTYQVSYFARLLFSNTSTTGKDYYFDDIKITGTKYPDNIPPKVTSLEITGANQLTLTFSERMSLASSDFFVSNGVGAPISKTISDDGRSVVLTFSQDFTTKKVYTLGAYNLFDFSSNEVFQTEYIFGLKEKPSEGDIIINEVLFNSPENAEEYVEIYNKSDKYLDVSDVKFTTRKSDGSLNSAYSLPADASIYPKGYLALCKTPSVVKQYFACSDTARFTAMTSFPALNNDGATILIANAAMDTIYDELTYSPKWHYPLIKNEQGVALERINSYLPTQNASNWHSASSNVRYGTPGYENSQYRALETDSDKKEFWLNSDVFSPNNDGDNDVLLIHYELPENGWMANITIFDANGQVISKVYKSYLLSTEGVLSWDGRTDSGKPSNIGLYVLYIELYNASTGKTKQIKLPCVVSGKK